MHKFLGLLVAVSSCRIDLEVPPNTLARCGAGAPECPPDYRCDQDLGYCLPNDPSDETAPTVSAENLTTGVIGPAQYVDASFTASEELIVPPVVTHTLGGNTLTWTLLAQNGLSYVFRYATTAGDPEGVTAVGAHLVDTSGNTNESAWLGNLNVDLTPPQFSSVTPTNTALCNNIAWRDDPVLELGLAVTDSGSGLGIVTLEGDVLIAGSVSYAPSLSVDLDPGDGVKAVTLIVSDAAGNQTAPQTVVVQLDSSMPATPLRVDDPTPVVNADSLLVAFRHDGAPAPDSDGFAVALNGGGFAPVGTSTSYLLNPLPQDTVTTLAIAERDCFGNLTEVAGQALVTVREDSQPPSPPQIAAGTLIAGFGPTAGVYLVTSSQDPGGFPFHYEVLAEGSATFVNVGSEPFLRLPGVVQQNAVTFLLRAVDEAGNASLPSFEQIIDQGMKVHPAPAFVPFGRFARGQFASRDGRALYTEGTSGSRALVVCAPLSPSALTCEPITQHFGASYATFTSADLYGRNVVYAPVVDGVPQGVFAYDLGPDRSPATSDDVDFDPSDGQTDIDPLLLAVDGVCAAVGAGAALYGRPDMGGAVRLYWYGSGQDGLIGTTDAGEGELALALNTYVSPCDTGGIWFDGRHFIWRDAGDGGGRAAGFYFADLGADLTPNTSDDMGEVYLPDSVDLVLLDEGQLLFNGTLVHFGPDARFNTADDTVEDFGSRLLGFAGDKLLATSATTGFVELIDRSSDSVITFGSVLGTSVEQYLTFSMSPGLLLASVRVPGTTEVMPAFLELRSRSGFDFTTAYPSRPGGTASGDLAVIFDLPALGQMGLRNIYLPGEWSPPDGWQVFALGLEPSGDVDIDGTRVVYRGLDDAVWIFDVGPDLLVNTADDRGPAVVASPGSIRWPRVSGSVVVWAEMTANAAGAWPPGYDSRIRALDLGADGWVGGGDDIAHSVTSGGMEVLPDVASGYVVWLDLRDDPDRRCVDNRGQIEFWTCIPAIWGAPVGGSEAVLAGAVNPRSGLQIEGDHLVWVEWLLGAGGYEQWDVFLHILGGSTVRVTDTPTNENQPCIAGNRLGYFTSEPTIVDLGADAQVGTADDTLLSAPTDPQAFSEIAAVDAARSRWILDSGYALAHGRFLPWPPVRNRADSGPLTLAIPDASAGGVEQALAFAVAEGQVDDFTVHVTVTHPRVSDLTISLLSPSGDEALLYMGAVAGGGANLDATFGYINTPTLFDHYAEPVAGTWRLRVADQVAGASGALAQVVLENGP